MTRYFVVLAKMLICDCTLIKYIGKTDRKHFTPTGIDLKELLIKRKDANMDNNILIGLKTSLIPQDGNNLFRKGKALMLIYSTMNVITRGRYAPSSKTLRLKIVGIHCFMTSNNEPFFIILGKVQ